ncbi:hypothetical protein FRB93_007966 [Tulasnella sp. JGI-2019a]|nr:hypothetical protein FRB93_007966 [Tulasnella sp. JGI-2019a]
MSYFGPSNYPSDRVTPTSNQARPIPLYYQYPTHQAIPTSPQDGSRGFISEFDRDAREAYQSVKENAKKISAKVKTKLRPLAQLVSNMLQP